MRLLVVAIWSILIVGCSPQDCWSYDSSYLWVSPKNSCFFGNISSLCAGKRDVFTKIVAPTTGTTGTTGKFVTKFHTLMSILLHLSFLRCMRVVMFVVFRDHLSVVE